MTAIFVTGTGTDIGKTFVTVGLIRHLRAAGRAADAIKPVVSGFNAENPAASDPAILLEALGRPAAEIDRICRWRFAAPLAPAMAARHEGHPVEFHGLVDFCRRAVVGHRDMMFIEGVGGIMVPLDETHTVLDWMTALRLPLLVVAGSYLGTISHTLTALQVLARRNLEITAVVVSESEGSATPLDDTVATIARFVNPIEVIGLPRLPPGTITHPAFARIAELI